VQTTSEAPAGAARTTGPARPRRTLPLRLPLSLTRAYLWICGAACGFGALLLGTTLPSEPGSLATVALFGVLAVASMAGTRLPAGWLTTGLCTVLVTVMLALTTTTLTLGWGLGGPGLPMSALMVCALCTAAGWRAGALLAAVATGGVLAVTLGGSGSAAGAASPTLLLQLGTHLLAIGTGLACGVAISRVMSRTVGRAQERELRLRHLLALAADASWETDRRHHIVAATDHTGEMRPLPQGHGLAVPAWEMPQLHTDAETLDLLQAEMEARRPFRDVRIRWRPLEGRMRAFLCSGEPRLDARGVFTGYWGVSRDVTDMLAAQEALAATETRYQELFTRIPTPLVLHRAGQVIDANAAAVQLFGHADLAAMQGTDLLAHYESGDSRERARRRLDQLADQPPGTALPVTSFRLHVQDHVVSVRAASVRVDVGGARAVLAIFVDDTERLAAEDAVRRSEALLSHLVATSPDLITLTEMATGCYAMVNQSFERVTGWSAAEAVGRTSVELGIWAQPEDRDRVVALVRSKGQVNDLPAYFVTKTGKAVAMVLSAARFIMDRGEYLVINARDVTERERQRLEREAILNNASIGIAVTRHGRFVLTNPHFERIYGWDRDGLLGQPGRVVWSSDQDFEAAQKELAPRLERGEAVAFERAARRRDGSAFTAHVRGHVIDPHRPLEAGTVWIVEDVTGRRDAEQALARARDDAEAANRAKSAFLANTSHELRTPLNGMIGLARLAGDGNTDDTRRQQYLAQIVDNAQALAGIISDILDLSKIEAGKLQVESTAFDLGALLQALQGSYATLASAHGLALRVETSSQAIGHVIGDPLRVRQIASNFLANAIKFTANGWVALRASRPDGQGTPRLRLEVQDTGPGIAEALRARLFQPFTQGDDSTTRRFGGTGLGLSICRELAALMGGQVGVDSAPGQGSTFWAELELPPTAAPPLRAPSRGAGDTGLAGRRVLMAEDNPVNMMIAVAMLEGWGVQVAQAADGAEAVAAVERAAAAGHPYDAVLMDVQMPVMSGHEATRCLRQRGHALPVIALTAAALVTERDTALAVGMNDFLTKPIDGERLATTLLRWCTQRQPQPAGDA